MARPRVFAEGHSSAAEGLIRIVVLGKRRICLAKIILHRKK
nr:MAG TPA: hypothetical protein [Caudoviricetes sp.]